MNVYFDNAATTPIEKKVLDKMLPFMEDGFGNPSSIHKRGREIKSAIEKSRTMVAEILCCEPGEIFFTSGGTEADNMFLIKILNTFQNESLAFKTLLNKFKKAAAQNVIFGSLNAILPTFLTAFILAIMLTFFGFAKFITLEFIGVLLRIFQSLGNLNNSLTMVINSSVHIEDLYEFFSSSFFNSNRSRASNPLGEIDIPAPSS